MATFIFILKSFLHLDIFLLFDEMRFLSLIVAMQHIAKDIYN